MPEPSPLQTGISAPLDRRGPAVRVDVLRPHGDWQAIDFSDSGIAAAVDAVITSVPGAAGSRARVSVVLSCDAEVRRLNKAFRGIDQTTNVLAFPENSKDRADRRHGDQETEDNDLGGVILALETVRREARKMGVLVAHHATHLVIHGVLHLLGYDHGNARDAERMEALELRIMAVLSLPAPYRKVPGNDRVRLDKR